MFLLGAGFLALALVGTGCSGSAKNKLLVADASGASAEGVKIWAASPGDDLNDDNLVTDAAVSPASIATRLEDGTTWINGLGRDWSGSALLSYAGSDAYQLLTTEPGGDPTQLAQSSSLQSTVIRRGVYARTAEGCVLASNATSTEQIGTGSCSISSDERWVVSWSAGTGTGAEAADSPGLTIRDLRHDDDVEVPDLGTVTNAVALSADARVFAVVQAEGGYQGVVLDATDGSEIGRTDVFPFLDVSTLGAESEGFVILTSTEQGNSTLSYVDTDADVTEIEAGYYLVPVSNDHEITYLSFGETGISESAVRSWSPGDDEPETLLTGQVGAGTADGRLVIIREVSAEENAAGGAPAPENGAPVDEDDEDSDPATGPTVEFWRPGSAERLTRVLTIPAPEDTVPVDDGGTGATVSKVWVKGHTAYLQLDHASVSSFVRIDLTGDHSDAPIVNVEGLLLESLDTDGTALLTATGGSGEEIVAVGPHSEEPVTRATFARTGLNLIHEGVIYVTEVGGSTDAPTLSVQSIRVSGDDGPELLWEDRQLAGATWPEQNGATTTSITTIGSIIAAQQAAAEAQQSAAGAAGTATADTGTGTTAG